MSPLRSLLLVEEKLLEAEYFIDRLHLLSSANHIMGFIYELNAFLSAARSVTFLLQKEMNSVPGFDNWWNDRVAEMSSDLAMRFFKNSRKFSQKEGSISLIIGGLHFGRECLIYQFGQSNALPEELIGREVVECCREHLAKLATVVLAYADAFPFYSCPRRAVTVEGIRALGLQPSDIEEMLGFPSGWTDVPGTLHRERVRVLQEQFDGVDFERIGAIAHG